MNEAHAEEILTEELGGLLEFLAEDEVGLARAYVRTAGQEARLERVFGFPGGGEAFLFGRLGVFVAATVAGTLIKNIPDADLQTTARGMVSFLLKRAPGGAEMLACGELIPKAEQKVREQGWEERDVRAGARAMVQAGERTAARMVSELSGVPREDAVFPAPRLRALRAVLAALYGNGARARIVAADVGIETARVRWDAPAEEVWFAVLEEARHQCLVGAIVYRAREDYGANPELAAVAAAMGLR